MNRLNLLIEYLHTFAELKVPYRWWKIWMPFYQDDMFYTQDGKPPTAHELIEQDKSIVCSGLINLARRFMNLPVPEIDGIKGTTWTWFRYLDKKEPIDTSKSYPVGTMLLRDYSDSQDQGHVAIIVTKGIHIHTQTIIHAIPFHPIDSPLKNVGHVCLTQFVDSHYYPDGRTFYTHICLPEYWLY